MARYTPPSLLHGEEIVKLRFELGMTQQQFADTMHVSVSLVQKWEHNRRRMTQDSCAFLMSLFPSPLLTATVPAGVPLTVLHFHSLQAY